MGTLESLPQPECEYGYTREQVKEIMGERVEEFLDWHAGQTGVLCQGEGKCGGEAHGAVWFYWDVERFLMGGPVID